MSILKIILVPLSLILSLFVWLCAGLLSCSGFVFKLVSGLLSLLAFAVMITYPLKGKAFCGCCGHALSRTMQKTSYYYCRHSEADEESRCHKMRLNAAELEQAVFLTLKKQMEAAAPLAPDGTLQVDASVPERAEYEQQIEALQDGKRTLYERYLMGEIDLNTYKAEKAACDELLLKTKNAYAAVLAQAKQKQDEQARQDSRKEASKAIFDADTLTTELAELLIDRVLVYPDKCIEIAYKIQDIFD